MKLKRSETVSKCGKAKITRSENNLTYSTYIKPWQNIYEYRTSVNCNVIYQYIGMREVNEIKKYKWKLLMKYQFWRLFLQCSLLAQII